MREPSSLRSLLGGLVLAATLSACTGTPAAPASPPAGNAPAAAATDAPPAQPKVNRLVFATAPPQREGSNPARDVGSPDMVQLRPMYEYLIGIDPATGKREAQLATEWSISPDGKAYTFKLRPGVRYHGDNGELSSKDVSKAFWDIVQTDSIHGSSKYWLALVDRVDDSNPLTAVLYLKKPDAQAIGNISAQLTGIELKSTKQYDALGHTPTLQEGPLAGTGPYQYKERRQGEYVRFERVPYQHWRQQAAFPELEIRFIREASTRLAGLLTGEIHMTPLPEDLLAQAQKSSMQVVKGTVPGVRAFLQFRGAYLADRKNPTSGWKYPNSPLTDVRVRRALAKAVNLDELNKTLMAGKGDQLYLNHYNQRREGWSDDWVKRFPDEYGYDPAKAKELLAQAGYGPNNPLKTTIVMVQLAELPQSLDILEAAAGYWRAVGAQVNLISPDRTQDGQKTNALEYDNAITIFTAPSDQYLGIQIFNVYTGAFAGSNVDIPQVDDIYLNKVLPEPNDAKRAQYLTELGNAMFESHQHVPLFWVPVQVAYDPRIVSQYVFPGSTSGLYTHLEGVKAAR